MNLNIDFEDYYLPNGLRVILHEDHLVPIVTINLWYKVGSKNEVRGKTGFAHLFEHMMFQGSQHVPAEMHFQLIQSIGGTLNGSTFFDRTNYFETLPSHYLELGLWLESDRMGFLLPSLTQDQLDRQREVVKNERRQRVDNQPYGTWLEKLLESAYPEDFPYHWPIIGYMEDLDRATLHDISIFFQTYYRPNNASLVIAGDFSRVKARELVDKYFGSLPAGPNIPQTNFNFDSFSAGEKSMVIEDNVQLARLYRAYHLPPYGANEMYSADLISDILSQGKSARLYQELVYKSQIAQDANAFLLAMQESSLLICVVTAKPQTDYKILDDQLDREINKLRETLIDDAELSRIKNQVEARKVRELQSLNSKADNLNLFATYFDQPDLINREIEHYQKLTPQDIQTVSDQFLVPENRVSVQYLPRKLK